jgi:Leucine-rich repeat (LRR) protein
MIIFILRISIECISITVFPYLTRFKNLKDFNCFDNELTCLPNSLPQSIEKLNCSNNQLNSLHTILPQNQKALNFIIFYKICV